MVNDNLVLGPWVKVMCNLVAVISFWSVCTELTLIFLQECRLHKISLQTIIGAFRITDQISGSTEFDIRPDSAYKRAHQ